MSYGIQFCAKYTIIDSWNNLYSRKGFFLLKNKYFRIILQNIIIYFSFEMLFHWKDQGKLNISLVRQMALEKKNLICTKSTNCKFIFCSTIFIRRFVITKWSKSNKSNKACFWTTNRFDFEFRTNPLTRSRIIFIYCFKIYR